MTTTAKVPNYTEAQANEMVEAYKANPTQETVEALAKTLSKNPRSIVAKLSREGVYKAKVYATKTGNKVERKNATADAIGKVLLLTEAETESLTKANKTTLVKIFTALVNSKPI